MRLKRMRLEKSWKKRYLVNLVNLPSFIRKGTVVIGIAHVTSRQETV
jgi:hypothetical protein